MIYNLSTKLNFGKHKGKTIQYICRNDANYIEWCIKNIDSFCIDHNAMEFVNNKGLFSFVAIAEIELTFNFNNENIENKNNCIKISEKDDDVDIDDNGILRLKYQIADEIQRLNEEKIQAYNNERESQQDTYKSYYYESNDDPLYDAFEGDEELYYMWLNN